MRYLLDTNTCIRFLSRRSPALIRRLAAVPFPDVVLCDVVKAELYYGAERSRKIERNLATLCEFFSHFESLPFDGTAARDYGRIRAELEAQGTPIGPNDLLIAAIARPNGLTLVTHNTREFSRVTGLSIEDWEANA